MHKAQKKMQKHALGLAQNSRVSLDYNSESMMELDKLVAKIAAELKEAKITNEIDITSNDGVKGIAEALGCYIAECAERKHGKGKWINTDPETNESRLGLALSTGNIIFPMEWVLRKLIDPSGYSINAVYSQFVT